MSRHPLRALFLGIVLLVLNSCSKGPSIEVNQIKSEEPSFIIGGKPVSSRSMLAASTVSIALIQSENEYYVSCTGTLISPDLILTATHCVGGNVEDLTEILYIGTSNQTAVNQNQVVKVLSVKTHPDYKGERLNDIALVRTTGLITNKKPVAILDEAFPLKPGQPMILAGYGVMDDITMAESNALRQVTVPLHQIIDDSILVTDQTSNKGACSGDSGGPAYLLYQKKLFVFGVTHGPHAEANDCHHYGEYTYASKFKDFILDGAKEMGAQAPIFMNPAVNSTVNSTMSF